MGIADVAGWTLGQMPLHVRVDLPHMGDVVVVETRLLRSSQSSISLAAMLTADENSSRIAFTSSEASRAPMGVPLPTRPALKHVALGMLPQGPLKPRGLILTEWAIPSAAVPLYGSD